MNFSDPLIVLLIIPIVILVVFFLKELVSNTSNAEFSSKWFSFKKTDSDHLMKEIISLKKEVESLRSDINYRHSKDDVKYEYRSKLARILKKYENSVVDRVDKEFIRKKSSYTTNQMRSLDEYKLILGQLGLITRTMVIKAMDDFDKNGFDKIGLDLDGKFDYKLLVNYLEEKPKEYEIEIKKFFLVSEHPLTLIDINGVECSKELHNRLIVMDIGEFEKIILDSLDDVSSDISCLYDFTINKMKSLYLEYSSKKTNLS